MPNWCQNTLEISGDEKQIEQFKEDAYKEQDNDQPIQLSIEKLYPVPEDQKDNWYNWCIENWGTKWDTDCSDLIDEDTEFLIYEFQSAWNPPVEAFTEISKKYPDLEFRLKYEEGGCCYMGVAMIKNGKCNDQCINY